MATTTLKNRGAAIAIDAEKKMVVARLELQLRQLGSGKRQYKKMLQRQIAQLKGEVTEVRVALCEEPLSRNVTRNVERWFSDYLEEQKLFGLPFFTNAQLETVRVALHEQNRHDIIKSVDKIRRNGDWWRAREAYQKAGGYTPSFSEDIRQMIAFFKGSDLISIGSVDPELKVHDFSKAAFCGFDKWTSDFPDEVITGPPKRPVVRESTVVFSSPASLARPKQSGPDYTEAWATLPVHTKKRYVIWKCNETETRDEFWQFITPKKISRTEETQSEEVTLSNKFDKLPVESCPEVSDVFSMDSYPVKSTSMTKVAIWRKNGVLRAERCSTSPCKNGQHRLWNSKSLAPEDAVVVGSSLDELINGFAAFDLVVRAQSLEESFDALKKKSASQNRENQKLKCKIARQKNNVQREIEKEKMRRQRNRKARAEAKLLGTSVDSVVAQAWEEYLPASVRTTLEIPSAVAGAARSAAMVTDHLTSSTLPSVDALFGTLNEIMENIRSATGIATKYNICDVLSSAYLLFTSVRNNERIGMLASARILANSLKIDLKSLLTIIYNTIVCYFRKMKETALYVFRDIPENAVNAQSFVDSLSSAVGCVGDAVSEQGWLTMTLASIFGIFGFVLSGKIPEWKFIAKWFGDVGRMSNGVKSIRDFYNWLLERVEELYYHNVCGMSSDSVKFLKQYPRAETLVAVAKYVSSLDLDPVDRSEALADEIINLRNELQDMKIEALQAKDDRMAKIINEYLLSIKKHYEAALNSPAKVSKARDEPFSVYIASEAAGTGKTTMVELVQTAIYNAFIRETGVPYGESYFVRKAGNDYWEGYKPHKTGQHITIFDDFFQLKDSVAKPNPEILEVISTKNTSPFQLHMANLNEKKNTYFISKYMLFSSNILRPEPKSVNSTQALRRRFDLCVEVNVRPEFGSRIPDTDKYRYNKEKADQYREMCGMEIPTGRLATDFYSLRVYNMESGETIPGMDAISYSHFEAYMLKCIAAHQKRSLSMKLEILERAGIAVKKPQESDSVFVNQIRKLNVEKLVDASATPSLKEYVETKFKALREKVADKTVESVGSIIEYSDVLGKAKLVSCFRPVTESSESIENVSREIKSESYPVEAQQSAYLNPLYDGDMTKLQGLKPYRHSAVELMDTDEEIFEDSTDDENAFPPPVDGQALEELLDDSDEDLLKDEGYSIYDDSNWDCKAYARYYFKLCVQRTNNFFVKIWEKLRSATTWISEKAKEFYVFLKSFLKEIFSNAIPVISIGLSAVFATWVLKPFFPAKEKRNACSFWIYFVGKPCISECKTCLDFNLTSDEWRQELVDLASYMVTDSGTKSLSVDSIRTNRLFKWYIKQMRAESGIEKTLKPVQVARVESRSGRRRVKLESGETVTLKPTTVYRTESGETVTMKPKVVERVESGETVVVKPPGIARVEALSLQNSEDAVEFRNPEEFEFRQYFKNLQVSKSLYASGDLVRVEQAKATIVRNGAIMTFRKMVSPTRVMRSHAMGVFLRGRIAIVNRHSIPKDFQTVSVFNPWQKVQKAEIPSKDIKISELKDASGALVDAMLIEFPTCVISRPDITSKFASASTIPLASDSDITLDGLRMVNGLPVVYTRSTNKFKIYESELTLGHEKGHCESGFKYNRAIHYDLFTEDGDSGGILTANSPLMPSKIIGIHCGGMGTRGNGIGLPLSQEFVRRSLQEHVQRHNTAVQNRIDSTASFSAQSSFMYEMTDPVEVEMESVQLPKKGTCIHMGTAPKPAQPVKTVLQKSPISGVFGPPTARPAQLTSFKLGEKTIEPHEFSSSKLLDSRPYVDQTEIKVAMKELMAMMGKPPKGSYYRRVLTIEEAIAAEGIQEITSVKRSTSKGYPSTLKGTCNNKKELLGYDGEYVVDPELRGAVEAMIATCKAGKRPDAIWQAMLKDERRPHAKVDAGQTRQIYASWIVLLVVHRMYFGGMVAWTVKNRIKNGCCIGVNPYSLEWQKMALELQSKGERIVSGDHKNYDGNNNGQITNALLELVEYLYDDHNPTNATVRAALWETMMNADIIINGEVVRLDHSQPSGNYLTTWVNCCSNILYHIMIFNENKRKAGKLDLRFMKEIVILVFGDDVLYSVSKAAEDFFSFPAVRDAFMRLFDMVYTLETKSSEDIGYRPLEEVEFLKRGFRLNEYGVYVAPLNLASIHEMVNWVKGKRVYQSCAVNVSFAVRELYFHGREVYEEHVAILEEACQEAGVDVFFPVYEDFDENWAYENGFKSTESPFTTVSSMFNWDSVIGAESEVEYMDTFENHILSDEEYIHQDRTWWTCVVCDEIGACECRMLVCICPEGLKSHSCRGYPLAYHSVYDETDPVFLTVKRRLELERVDEDERNASMRLEFEHKSRELASMCEELTSSLRGSLDVLQSAEVPENVYKALLDHITTVKICLRAADPNVVFGQCNECWEVEIADLAQQSSEMIDKCNELISVIRRNTLYGIPQNPETLDNLQELWDKLDELNIKIQWYQENHMVRPEASYEDVTDDFLTSSLHETRLLLETNVDLYNSIPNESLRKVLKDRMLALESEIAVIERKKKERRELKIQLDREHTQIVSDSMLGIMLLALLAFCIFSFVFEWDLQSFYSAKTTWEALKAVPCHPPSEGRRVGFAFGLLISLIGFLLYCCF